MKLSVREFALTIGTALGLALAGPSFSQDDLSTGPGAQGGGILEEVMVTARRIEENIQDVPISITVFNQERLSDLNVVNAMDLALVTPSLAASPLFGSENANLQIRGFRQDLDTPPSVGVYFADVVVPRGATQGVGTRDVILPGSMFDLQNVQVLKGPQGTLFGRNTTGGAVLLVPQKPADEVGGYVEASVGNYDMQRLQGMVNTPLNDDLRLRIAVDRQKRDGYIDNIAGVGSKDFEDLNYQALRASLVWDVTEDIENYTIASFYKSDTNATMEKLIACNPDGLDPLDLEAGFTNFIGILSCGQLDAAKARGADFHDVESPFPGLSRIQQWQVINTTTWDLSETLRLKNIASYAEYENTQKTGLFGTNWQVETLPDIYASLLSTFGVPQVFTAINAAPGLPSADQSTYTEELQVQGAFLNDRLTYQAGAYFEWSDPEGDVGNRSPTLVLCTDVGTYDCTDPVGNFFTLFGGQTINVGQVGDGIAQTTFRNRGLYAQSTYEFSDQLRLTAGLRYTWDKQEADIYHTLTTFDVTAPYTDPPSTRCDEAALEPTCQQTVKTESDEPTWLIGLDYFPAPDVLLYAKYSRGYRAGGIVNRAPFDFRTFDPEELDNYELGLKTSFQGAISGTFNVGAFYNELTDQQYPAGFHAGVDEEGNSTGTAPTTGIVNAAESRMYGAEIEASVAPVDGLVISLSYTWLEAEIRKIEDIDTVDPLYEADTITIESGSPIWQSPKNQVNLSANYSLPVDPGLGRVTVGLTYLYIDD